MSTRQAPRYAVLLVDLNCTECEGTGYVESRLGQQRQCNCVTAAQVYREADGGASLGPPWDRYKR